MAISFPAAQHHSQRPSPPLSRSAQLRASSPAARSAPAQPCLAQQPRASASPAPGNRPRPAADARAPPVGAAPNLPHPAPAPGQGGTTVSALASWARPPVPLGLVKKAAEPPLARPLLPRSIFASTRPQLPHGGAPPTTVLAVRVAVVSEPSPPPIFARGELAVVPSLSPCVSFRVSWLIAPNPRAP